MSKPTIEAKEILAYLGIEGDDIEAVKTAFDGTFIKRDAAIKDPDIIDKVVGTKMGSVETNVRKSLKAAGVDLPSDVKGVDATVKFGVDYFSTKLTEASTELEEARKGKPDEAAIKKLQTEVEKYKGESAKYKGDWETLGTEFNTFKESADKEKVGMRLGWEKDKLTSLLPFGQSVNTYTKAGFIGEMDKKYRLEFDDKGALIIKDAAGNDIKDPKKSGAVLAPIDVYKMEIEAAKLNDANPAGGKPVGGFGGKPAPVVTDDAAAKKVAARLPFMMGK